MTQPRIYRYHLHNFIKGHLSSNTNELHVLKENLDISFNINDDLSTIHLFVKNSNKYDTDEVKKYFYLIIIKILICGRFDLGYVEYDPTQFASLELECVIDENNNKIQLNDSMKILDHLSINCTMQKRGFYGILDKIPTFIECFDVYEQIINIILKNHNFHLLYKDLHELLSIQINKKLLNKDINTNINIKKFTFDALDKFCKVRYNTTNFSRQRNDIVHSLERNNAKLPPIESQNIFGLIEVLNNFLGIMTKVPDYKKDYDLIYTKINDEKLPKEEQTPHRQYKIKTVKEKYDHLTKYITDLLQGESPKPYVRSFSEKLWNGSVSLQYVYYHTYDKCNDQKIMNINQIRAQVSKHLNNVLYIDKTLINSACVFIKEINDEIEKIFTKITTEITLQLKYSDFIDYIRGLKLWPEEYKEVFPQCISDNIREKYNLSADNQSTYEFGTFSQLYELSRSVEAILITPLLGIIHEILIRKSSNKNTKD